MNRQMERNRVMKAVTCLECDRRVTLGSKTEVGDIISCPSCDSEFEVVGLMPARIEWAYDDYDYDEDFDDEIDDYDESNEE